ncbi:MAG: DUF3440 domain-containing protein [Candidatus Omnitrophota bacterium]|jgi:predicted phosphoadenosine phosphosulfate sulfurtransferase|nr:MAG: DUF3440 domain-containing protein [Candidatus Omnitrophota bacterium]
MPKRYLGINVYDAARKRVAYVFDHFPRIYVSFSGGKDSTAMLHLVAEEARRRQHKIGLLCVDFEAQYRHTYEHVATMYELYADIIEPYWVTLPISLDNGVSEYQPRWICWEPGFDWVRPRPSNSIGDQNYFPFYSYAMEFEEFVPAFGEWYSQGQDCAAFIGIRTEESYNRHLKLAVRHNREFHGDNMWALKQKSASQPVYSIHPIYDWKVEDIWRYHGKFGKPYNRIYDLMHKAGLSLHQARLCQPYGVDQRKGLWLFHILEPETWSKIVARVNGANSGAEFVKYSGNISGQIKIHKPAGHTWRSFALLLLKSMPQNLAEHYDNKIFTFIGWWMERGGYWDDDGNFYPIYGSIPDEVDHKLEVAKKAPSWKRICKSLLRSDYWCKGIGFVPTSSPHYDRYRKYMADRKRLRGYIPLWRR